MERFALLKKSFSSDIVGLQCNAGVDGRLKIAIFAHNAVEFFRYSFHRIACDFNRDLYIGVHSFFSGYSAVRSL
jgi:hypothetical protein